MRVRNYNTERILVVNHKINGSGPPGTCDPYSSAATYNVPCGTSGVIKDQLGVHRENPCEHTQIFDNTPEPSAASTIVLSNGYTFRFERMNHNIYARDREWGRFLPLGDLGDSDSAFRGMYESVLPVIVQQMDESVANFAIDLPKLKRVPALLPRARTLKNLIPLLKKHGRQRWLWSEFARFLANANLGVHFGILPLLDDIKVLYESLEYTRKRLNTLRSNANKRITRRLRQSRDVPMMEYRVDRPDSGPSCKTASAKFADSTLGRVFVSSNVRSLKIRYSYRYPDYPYWLARTYALMDAYGLNFNPKILWDATRLSFVVDWFLKVGNFLEQYQYSALQPQVVIHSCTYSHNVVSRRLVFTNWRAMTECVYDVTTQQYKRWVGVPPMESLKTTLGVDLFKIHIASSLLVQGWRGK